jgi:hypothetical protein
MRSITLRLLLLCLLAAGTSIHSIAQYSPYGYAQGVDEILQYVDKTPITTGLLYDRAFPHARLDLFNQTGTIDTTSPDHFDQGVL